MGQLVIHKVKNTLRAKLRRRAKRHGRSLEDEARSILCDAVNEDEISARGLGTEISKWFSKVGLDSDVGELRGRKVGRPRS